MANPWGMNLDLNAPQGPATDFLNMLTPAQLAQTLGPATKNAKPTQRVEQKIDNRKTVKQDTYKDNALTQDQINMISMSEPVASQKAGIAEMEDYLNMQAQAGADRSNVDLRPLAALADYENAKSGNRSNLAASAAVPEDIVNKLLQQKKMVQDQKEALSKNIQEGVKNLKSGSTSDSTNQLLASMAAMGMGGQFGNREGMQNDRLFYQMLARAQGDQTTNKLFTQNSNLSNAIANAARAEVLTPAQFHELQQSVFANLGIKGTSSAAERAQRMMDSLGMKKDEAAQFVSGNPQMISGGLNNPLVRHILDLAQQELGNIKGQAGAQFDSRTAGYEGLMQEPAKKTSYENARKAALARFDLPEETVKALAAHAPKAHGAKGGKKKVTESDIDNMSIEQLKAEGLL